MYVLYETERFAHCLRTFCNLDVGDRETFADTPIRMAIARAQELFL